MAATISIDKLTHEVMARKANALRLIARHVERDDPLVRQSRREGIAMAELHAHHIVRWADDPSQRLIVKNGMALCEPCHIEEHRRYG